MVEVFKTNISKAGSSKTLIKKLAEHYPASSINIDLQDCDKVLRVEGDDVCPYRIIELVTADGYECEPLI